MACVLPVIGEMIEQVRVPSIAEVALVHVAYSCSYRREFVQERQGSRYNFQVEKCPTFDCLGLAISTCAVVYDVDLRYSALVSWLCLSL